MTKNRLYDENDRYTDDTGNLDSEVTRALKPIFDKYIKTGYSFRDIAHVMIHAVFGLEMETILTEGLLEMETILAKGLKERKN